LVFGGFCEKWERGERQTERNEDWWILLWKSPLEELQGGDLMVLEDVCSGPPNLKSRYMAHTKSKHLQHDHKSN
jgi:hypothetical protein